MKAKDIVKATKEYERLQGLINNIESAFRDLEKTETNPKAELASVQMAFGNYVLTAPWNAEPETVSINPILHKEVSELMRSDMKELFNKHLYELRVQQGNLEVY